MPQHSEKSLFIIIFCYALLCVINLYVVFLDGHWYVCFLYVETLGDPISVLGIKNEIKHKRL